MVDELNLMIAFGCQGKDAVKYILSPGSNNFLLFCTIKFFIQFFFYYVERSPDHKGLACVHMTLVFGFHSPFKFLPEFASASINFLLMLLTRTLHFLFMTCLNSNNLTNLFIFTCLSAFPLRRVSIPVSFSYTFLNFFQSQFQQLTLNC